jgi:hypothetical protein
MALKKDKDTKKGAQASYWRVEEISIDWQRSISRVIMRGYFQSNQNVVAEEPLSTYAVDFGYTLAFPPSHPLYGQDHTLYAFPFTKEGKNVKEAYDAIKSLPEWSGSEDI